MLLRSWVLLCAGLVAQGWLLTPFGALKESVYVVLLSGAGILGLFHAFRSPRRRRRIFPGRWVSMRLFLPGIFAFSTVVLLFRGLSMPPFHDDGLCYRIPRVMHWIMDHRWDWISADDRRLDVLGTVSEWLTVPILLIFKTDRLVFLPNWICQLFLPGMIFSVWKNLGVSPRIAWLAMWLLPTGFCFALQAINPSNDSLAAFFVLAAFFFALKEERATPWNDYALSILCIALATGVKLNQIPLMLAWAAAFGAGWKVFFARRTLAALVLLWAALISFLPTGLINYAHGRGWTGLAIDALPPIGVNYVCTSYRILAGNLVPPVLPFTPLGEHMLSLLQHSLLGDLLAQYYHETKPIFYIEVAVQQAGIGFAVSIMLLLLILATKGDKWVWEWRATHHLPLKRSLIFLGLGLAFLHYLLFVYSDQPARLICTYYVLLTPVFFSGRKLRGWFPFRLCKIFTAMAMLTGLYLAFFFAENAPYPLLKVLNEREIAEQERQKEVDAIIPSSEKNIGVIRYWNQRESWLWKPYGSRKVMEFPVQTDFAQVDHLGIRYMVVSKKALKMSDTTIEAWMAGQPWKLDRFVVTDPDQKTWYEITDGWYVLERTSEAAPSP